MNALYVCCKLGEEYLDTILIGLLLHRLKLLKILAINLKCFTRQWSKDWSFSDGSHVLQVRV